MDNQSVLENNRRVLKNTMLLYIRMLFVMGVSLFTVRIVLKYLGVTDYGIYSVVGGVVMMMAFLSNSMSSATQRFFSFDLGRRDYESLRKTFSTSLFIYILFSLIVLLIAETGGIWFLKNRLTLPADRLDAAIWTFQFSILSFIVSIITIPYNALIVAREKMSTFAYFSVFEVIAKLVIAYILSISVYDRLIVYSFLMFLITSIVFLLFRYFCVRQFSESHIIYVYDRGLLKKLIGFTGWNLFGSIAGVFNNQGANIILNIFFGPAVNGARALSFQLSNSLNQFVTNFMLATRPQITKYYAKGEMSNMMNLVFTSSKFSFFLLMIFGIPILLETHIILQLWLNEVPAFVEIFTKLTIFIALVDSLSYSLMTAAQATGNIKSYQAIVGTLLLLSLPISYVFFELHYPPYAVMIITLCVSIIALFARLFMLKGMISLDILKYLKDVVLRILLVFALSYFSIYFLSSYLDDGLLRVILVSFVSALLSISFIYFFGLNKKEKTFLKTTVNTLIQKYQFNKR
ncbi:MULTISPECIES: lipopolysaccharide biosynthesis protein [Sphingobacterium]|uniref:lipopolysaccharide biosynthesis protein n=1 Tax=Sphingobacterium TaxID=28453 RepID=UPI00257FCD9E|nr:MULTISPECIES: MATE family efflux transporter [Sphingobacterium]